MSRGRIATLAAAAAIVVVATFAGSAQADYHLVKVREVHRGTAFTGDYVMLQMYAGGQNLFGGHHVRILDGTGQVNADYVLNNAPNGQSQRTYLLGNTAVGGADQSEAGVIIEASGAVCYNDLGAGLGGIDCVAWGGFLPGMGGETPSSLTGNPAVPGGLGTDQSLVRTIARGCPTALDAADDTDNSAADFTTGTGTPRPNAVTPTETLCLPPAGTPTSTKAAKKCKKGFRKVKKNGKVKCKRKKKRRRG
jgi:hypothetical protein